MPLNKETKPYLSTVSLGVVLYSSYSSHFEFWAKNLDVDLYATVNDNFNLTLNDIIVWFDASL